MMDILKQNLYIVNLYNFHRKILFFFRPSSIVHRPSPAFTFLELLFVMIILGVFTAVAVPQLKKTFNTYQVNSFVRDFENSFNYFRQRSIMDGEVFSLKIDAENNECWGQKKNSPEGLRPLKIPEGIMLEIEDETIFFYPDGSIDKVTIKIFNKGILYGSLTTKGVWGGVKFQPQP